MTDDYDDYWDYLFIMINELMIMIDEMTMMIDDMMIRYFDEMMIMRIDFLIIAEFDEDEYDDIDEFLVIMILFYSFTLVKLLIVLVDDLRFCCCSCWISMFYTLLQLLIWFKHCWIYYIV